MMMIALLKLIERQLDFCYVTLCDLVLTVASGQTHHILHLQRCGVHLVAEPSGQ